ncbi:MAG: hypothetical protein ACAH88_16810 [Roseimicrobium sp.]
MDRTQSPAAKQAAQGGKGVKKRTFSPEAQGLSDALSAVQQPFDEGMLVVVQDQKVRVINIQRDAIKIHGRVREHDAVVEWCRRLPESLPVPGMEIDHIEPKAFLPGYLIEQLDLIW